MPMNPVLPDPLPITPLAKVPRKSVKVPGSKSFTNRAFPIAALARGPSKLTGVLDSEDTHLMREALIQLGIPVEYNSAECTAIVDGRGGQIPAREANLFLGNSGTSMRFLTALVSLGNGTYRLDGIERMRQRPMDDLLQAMKDLGVDIRSEKDNGCPPIIIKGGGLTGETARIRGDISSQFLSGLMIVAPLTARGLTIEVEGDLVSKPYVDMTLATMTAFDAEFERDGYQRFRFSGLSSGFGGYVGGEYAIEPDASAASYFFAAAAITGGRVTVEGLGTYSRQGDLQFVYALERMGCSVDMKPAQTTLFGGKLVGVDIDMQDISDTVPTLAAVACFAEGPTTIRHVAHIRHKETDRISALVQEIRKTGCQVDEFEDGLKIHPPILQAAIFDTYNDHRMAMSLALLGLRQTGIAIRDPGCTAKTYPGYFADLARLAEA
ncbi:3-phosphoshikimate 1-carboxyvinyltransferase [bacterium]|jgi:3-phosphoshikimate 1-carboxyvinyltransferase|nr:3-phosphoshikimate 1-carboxyvinyltransferase [bacterium]